MLSAPLINASSSVVNPSVALLHEIMHNDSVRPSVSVLCKSLIVIVLAVRGWGTRKIAHPRMFNVLICKWLRKRCVSRLLSWNSGDMYW